MIDRRTFEMEAATRAWSGEISRKARAEDWDDGWRRIMAAFEDLARHIADQIAAFVAALADSPFGRLLAALTAVEPEPAPQLPPPWRAPVVPPAPRDLVVSGPRHFRAHRAHVGRRRGNRWR